MKLVSTAFQCIWKWWSSTCIVLNHFSQKATCSGSSFILHSILSFFPLILSFVGKEQKEGMVRSLIRHNRCLWGLTGGTVCGWGVEAGTAPTLCLLKPLLLCYTRLRAQWVSITQQMSQGILGSTHKKTKSVKRGESKWDNDEWLARTCLSLPLNPLIFGTGLVKFFSLTLLHDKLTVTLYHLMMCAIQNKSRRSEVYFPSLSLFSLSSFSLSHGAHSVGWKPRAGLLRWSFPLHSASASLSSLLSPVHPGKLNNPMSQFPPLPPISIFSVQWAWCLGCKRTVT